MTIDLLYIRGINRIDTPYFSSLQEQEDTMEGFIVSSIETTFYPPHYSNKIRCSTADVDFGTEINYIRFQFRDKYYYYFIDDITYINEGLVEIDITMDYIQTYMFNIKIYSYEKVKFCIGNRLYFKPVYWNDLFILFKR